MADNGTVPNSRKVGQRVYDPAISPDVVLPWEEPMPDDPVLICKGCGNHKGSAAFQRNGMRNGKPLFVALCKRCVSRERYNQSIARTSDMHPSSQYVDVQSAPSVVCDEAASVPTNVLSRHVTLPFFFQIGDMVMNAASVAYFDLTLPNEVEVVLIMQEIDQKQGYVRPIRFAVRDTADRQEAQQLRQLLPLLARGSEEGLLEENRLLRGQLAEAHAARADIEQRMRDLNAKMAEMMDLFQHLHVSATRHNDARNGALR